MLGLCTLTHARICETHQQNKEKIDVKRRLRDYTRRSVSFCRWTEGTCNRKGCSLHIHEQNVSITSKPNWTRVKFGTGSLYLQSRSSSMLTYRRHLPFWGHWCDGDLKVGVSWYWNICKPLWACSVLACKPSSSVSIPHSAQCSSLPFDIKFKKLPSCNKYCVY